MLSHGEIHVWRINLEQPLTYLSELADALSSEEQARAARFYFDKDRRHYITGRDILRSILSGYLGVSPESVRFQYGRHGKPALTGDFASSALHFNLSHAHGLALCACVRDRAIGIDLEQLRPLADMEAIAQRFFSGAEYAQLRALPPDQKLEAFYNCWTRKEAYIKACGNGLARPLDNLRFR
jgi:4'-phosphopantetheinyl transferase